MTSLSPRDDPAALAALLATPPSPPLRTPAAAAAPSDTPAITTGNSGPRLRLSSDSQEFVPRAKDQAEQGSMFLPRTLHQLYSRETSPDAYATAITNRKVSANSNDSVDGFPSFRPFVPPPQADLSEDAIPASYLLNDDFYYQYVGAVKSQPIAIATRQAILRSPIDTTPRRPVTTGLVPPPSTVRKLAPSPHIDSPINTTLAESLVNGLIGGNDATPKPTVSPGRFAFRRFLPFVEPELPPIGAGIKKKSTEVSIDPVELQRGMEYQYFHHSVTDDEIIRSPPEHKRRGSDEFTKWIGERTSRRESLNNQQQEATHNRSESRNTTSSHSSRYSFATAFNREGYGGQLPPQTYQTPSTTPATHQLNVSTSTTSSANRGAAPWGHFAVPGGTADLRAIWDRPLPSQPSRSSSYCVSSSNVADFGPIGSGRTTSARSTGIIAPGPADSSSFWPIPLQSAQALQYARAQHLAQAGAPYTSGSIHDAYHQAQPQMSGDWVCPRMDCRFVNFARNTECKVCGTRKMLDDLRAAPQPQGPPLGSAGDWQCATCHFINWRRRTLCMKCFPDHPSNSDRSFNYPDPRSAASSNLGPYLSQYSGLTARFAGSSLLSPSPDLMGWYDGYPRGWAAQ